MRGRNYIGAPYPGEKGSYFVISVPVGQKGAPLGVLSVSVDVGEVWRGVAKKLEDRGALIYLVDSRGVLLNSSQKTGRSEGALLTDLNIVRRLISKKGRDNSERYEGLDGEDVFGADVYIETLAWGAVSETPVERITDPIMKALVPLLALGFTLFSVCAAFGIWRIRRVLKPIGELSSAFESVSAGDYSSEMAPSSVEEIDTLASGFHAMASAINQRKEALHKSEDALKRAKRSTA